MRYVVIIYKNEKKKKAKIEWVHVHGGEREKIVRACNLERELQAYIGPIKCVNLLEFDS